MAGWDTGIGRFLQAYPNLSILGTAVLAAGGMTLFLWWAGDADFLPLRGVYLAALICLSFDVLETASIGAGPRRLGNPDRWVLAGFHAWYLTAFLTLFLWEGPAQFGSTLIAALIGGAIYGLLMAFAPWAERTRQSDGHRFDLSRPVTDTRFGGLLYRLWPLISLVLILGFAAYPPDRGWDASYLLFQVVLLPFVQVRYPARRGSGALVPRLVGVALLVGGFFWLG